MKERSVKLVDLLKLEVAQKGSIATYAFASLAIVSYFYGFGTIKYFPIVKITSVVILVFIILRHFAYQHILRKKITTKLSWNITVFFININAVCFSLILNLATFESQLTSIHYAVVTTLLTGLIATSIVTLSYFPIIFLPFQVLMIFPQIAIVTYFHHLTDSNYLPLIALYGIYFVYQMKQFTIYRRDLIARFKYQLDLEEKNKELEKSKNIIMDQTIKLIHTSRLAVMGEMSIGISHEINNPLTVISGNINLIDKLINSQKNVLEKGTLEQFEKFITRISSAIKRVDKIIYGLKYYANPSDNKPKEVISLAQIIQETTSFLEELLNKAQIKLTVDKVPQVNIQCHPVQISQVLINIIKNAADALEETASLEDKWISLSFTQNENAVDIYITNGGEKIKDEVAINVFRPFYTTKTNKKGTGLGLSISDTIIKEHDGELLCDLSFKNTCFIIKLKTH